LHLAMSPHGTDGPSPIQKTAAGCTSRMPYGLFVLDVNVGLRQGWARHCVITLIKAC
jgi:hypothetical protein